MAVELQELGELLSSVPLSCTPHDPTPKQRAFLDLDCKEALYGGAAGGGKSDALLMAALQYVHVPNYAAIIFRETFADLSLPDGLIPRSHEWLTGSGASYDAQKHSWHFPSGAVLAFGYMDHERAHFRYQGAGLQFIGWDELTQHREYQYLWMFNRLRALEASSVPLRVRGATNPGGVGHRWVKRRFIDAATKSAGAVFVPSKLSDNPYLRADYEDSLNYLDSVTRARYLKGDWSVLEDDIFVYPFDRAVHVEPPPSTDPGYYRRRLVGGDPGKRDPYAVIVLCEDFDGRWWIVGEFYKTGGSTSSWTNEFQRMNDKWKPQRWYVDKRKPADILDIRNAGIDAVGNLDFYGETARDTIRPMIGIVQDIMISGKLRVSPECKRTIYEFEEYKYNDPADKNAGEVPIDANNHAMDAIRYALVSSKITSGDLEPRYRSARPVKPFGWKPDTRPLKDRVGSVQDAMRAQEAQWDQEASKEWTPVR